MAAKKKGGQKTVLRGVNSKSPVDYGLLFIFNSKFVNSLELKRPINMGYSAVIEFIDSKPK